MAADPNPPEYVNKALELWTSDDVAEWMDDNQLFYMASLPMKDLDGKCMCELLKILHASDSRGHPEGFNNFLATGFVLDAVGALKFTFCLRQLLVAWQKAKKKENPNYEGDDFILPYP